MNKLSYDEAFTQLKDILDQIEQGDISLDTLSVQVKKAHELILHCQSKFKEVEEEVAKILIEIKEEEQPENE